MATLPSVLDYGARPSLRSSRVDVPGSGNMEIASALENAASNFARISVENKQKDDALSYSNAKNEYLIADIQERAKLKEDKDYSTFDARYREAMKGHYARIFPTVTGKRDRLVFDAEARLMNERGVVEVSELGRKKRVDYEVGKYYADTEINKQAMLVEQSPTVVNDMMMTQSDRVDAMVAAGFFDETDGQAEKQRVVQAWAYDRLIDMDPKMRAQMLERSINGREMGGPVTPEDIRAGKGTDSVADFLHFETAVKMLRETQTENEIDDENAAARSIVDIAYEQHPDNFEAANILARQMAKDQKLDGSTRERLESMLTGASNEVTRNKNALQERIITENTDRIANGSRYEDISGVELSKLEPHQRAALETFAISYSEGREGFARPTEVRWTLDPDGGNSYAAWRNLTQEQKSRTMLDDAAWKSVFTRREWQSLKDEQDLIKSGKQTTLPGGLTNQQMVNALLVSKDFIPQTGRTDAEAQRYQQALFNFDAAVQAKQTELGRPLSNDERRIELARTMVPIAFIDRDFFTSDYDLDEAKPVAIMTQDELDKAYLPLARAAVQEMVINGTELTVEEVLRQMARENGVAKPSNNNLERAFFALDNGLGDDEVIRRLKGE